MLNLTFVRKKKFS